MSRFMTLEEIELKIVRFLRAIGMERVVPLDLMTVIVKMKEYLPGFNYRRVADDDLPNAEGMYDPEKRLLLIPESVFAGMNRGEPRHCFSIAHELSHAVLGHDEIRYRHVERQAYEKAKANIRREEFQANQGAAFMLAPTDLAQHCGSVEDLERKFPLGYTAAQIRWRDLQAHMRRKTGKTRPLPSGVIDFLNDQKRKGYDVKSIPDKEK